MVVKIDETRLDEAIGHLSVGRPHKGRETMVPEFTPTFGTLVGMDHCLHELTSVNAVHLRDRYYVFTPSPRCRTMSSDFQPRDDGARCRGRRSHLHLDRREERNRAGEIYMRRGGTPSTER